jgi:diphthamide biosynthesis protein 3
MTSFIPSYKDYFDKLQDFKNNEDIDFYDEVDIKEFTYDKSKRSFTYPCPCGDMFEIHLEDLINHEDVARCPSCSLVVKVVYEERDLKNYWN